jgi:cell division protein FtsW
VHSGPDAQLFVAALALAAIGLVMVFSASFAKAAEDSFTHHDGTYFMKRQFISLLVGLVALFAAYRTPLHSLRKSAYVWLGATLLLLVAVLVLGREVHGARRWFDLKLFQFQPSELAKLVVVIAAARFFADRPGQMGTLGALAKPLAMAGLVGVLIVAEHDLGTAMVLVMGLMALFSLGGARTRDLAIVAGAGLALLVIAVIVEPYRLARIIAWLHQDETALEGAYQMKASQLALGSGGLFGCGLGESRQKYFYLPAASTDCILAILGEELGFVGCITVVGLFGWLAFRGMSIAHRADDGFAALLAAGLTAMLFVQVALNICVVTGVLPTTGVPLPLISYGGSAMLFTMAGIGLIMNVSRQRQSARQARAAPRRRTILEM